MYNLLNS